MCIRDRFKYGTTHLGQGKEKARNFLKENPEVCEEIRSKILAAGGYVDDIGEKIEEAESKAKASTKLPSNAF